MDKRMGVVGGICVGFWARYRCDHGEPLEGICECNDLNSGRQHNFTTNPYRAGIVVNEKPYICSECRRLDVDALFYRLGVRLVEVLNMADALLGKHRGGKRLPRPSAVHRETAGSATENPGLGTPMGAQHQPSQKRHGSPESEAHPQRKSLRRSPGSVDLRAEAQRQASSSHSESPGNPPSGNGVVIGAGRTASNSDRLSSQRYASEHKAPAPAGAQQFANRPAANSVPHAVAERTAPSRQPGARNEEQPRRAPEGYRPRNHRYVTNSADRLSIIQEEPQNEGSPLPNKNYWALRGGPNMLGPQNITNPSQTASPHRAHDRMRNGEVCPRIKSWNETAEQQQGHSPVRSVHHEAAKPCHGDPRPRIPPREYVAVKSDNPLLSSPKPPRKYPAARPDNPGPSSSNAPLPFSSNTRPGIPAMEYTAVRPDDPRLSSPKLHRKNPSVKPDGQGLELPKPSRVYTAVGADNPLLSSPKPLSRHSRQS